MTILYDSTLEPGSYTYLTTTSGAGIWGGSFESDVDGGFTGNYTSTPDGLCFLRTETDIVRVPGSVALFTQIERNYAVKRNFRAEVIGVKANVNRNLDTTSRNVYWYAFSVWPLRVDYDDSLPEVIFQCHSGGAELPAAGGAGALPGAAPGLGVMVLNGRLLLICKCSPDQLAGSTVYYERIPAPLLVQGYWYDFVIENKVDWDNPGIGYVRMWVNDMLVCNVIVATGIAHTPDTYNGPYIKYGTYKSQWGDVGVAEDETTIRQRGYIHDAVRIGDASETFQSMRCSEPRIEVPHRYLNHINRLAGYNNAINIGRGRLQDF